MQMVTDGVRRPLQFDEERDKANRSTASCECHKSDTRPVEQDVRRFARIASQPCKIMGTSWFKITSANFTTNAGIHGKNA